MSLTHIQIELSGLCNLRCDYCASKTRTVGKQLMDVELAKSVIREAAKLKLAVSYHGMGESTLHPALIGLLTLGEHLGLKQCLATNCLEYVPELTEFRNTDLVLSLHGGAEQRDECLMNAVRYISEDFFAANPSILLTVVCAEGSEDFAERVYGVLFPGLIKIPKAKLHLKQPVTHPGQPSVKGFIFDCPDNPQILKDVYPTPKSIGRFCSMPDSFLEIMADGTTAPCCVAVDDWGLPNAKEGLRTVWLSERMQDIRGMWRNKSGDTPCDDCLNRGDC